VLYRFLADIVLLFHLAFVLFVVLGGFFALRWVRLIWLHLPAVAWGAYVEFSGRICPLTPLENSMRERGGGIGYSGGCIDHYITALLYPDGLTRAIQFGIGALVIFLNVVAYGLLLRRAQSSDHLEKDRTRIHRTLR